PEKLIPLMVLNAIAGDRLPVYGDGLNVRNWLYVEDFASAIGTALDRGVAGEVYNVGGPDACANIAVARPIAVLPVLPMTMFSIVSVKSLIVFSWLVRIVLQLPARASRARACVSRT